MTQENDFAKDQKLLRKNAILLTIYTLALGWFVFYATPDYDPNIFLKCCFAILATYLILVVASLRLKMKNYKILWCFRLNCAPALLSFLFIILLFLPGNLLPHSREGMIGLFLITVMLAIISTVFSFVLFLVGFIKEISKKQS